MESVANGAKQNLEQTNRGRPEDATAQFHQRLKLESQAARMEAHGSEVFQW